MFNFFFRASKNQFLLWSWMIRTALANPKNSFFLEWFVSGLLRAHF